MLIIVLIIYMISLYLSLFKPSYFLIVFGVLGSVYDGYGIGAYINGIIPVHYILFYTLLYISLISSFIYYIKNHEKKYNSILMLYLLFSITVIMSIIIYSLIDIRGTQSFSALIMDSMYKTADFTFIVAVILLLNHDRFNILKTLKYYVFVQITIAALVIYLPNIGIMILENINGLKHQGTLVYSSQYGATISNFFKVFSNKYYFNKFAHFHNSNDTGFFFGTALFLTICQVVDGNKIWRNIVISAILFVMWANSGMRAPIVAIIFSIFIYYLVSKFNVEKLFIFLFTSSVIIIPFILSDSFEVFLSFITGSKTTSVSPTEGRLDYIYKSFDFLKERYFIGFGTDLIRLSSNGITPHLLPLRIATMSGVFAGILSFFIVYLQPLYLIIKKKKFDFFSIGVYFILFFVSVTNNYTNIVLFNFLLAALVCRLYGNKV